MERQKFREMETERYKKTKKAKRQEKKEKHSDEET
jgi:hypothetical protein